MADQLGDLIETITHNLAAMSTSWEVSNLGPQLYWFHLEDRLTALFSRIESIRLLNYKSEIDLEADQVKAALVWINADPTLKTNIKAKSDDFLSKVKYLEREANDNFTSARSPQGDRNKLDNFKEQIAAYKVEAIDFVRQIQQDLAPLPSLLMSLELRVTAVESTLDLTSTSSFKLLDGEALYAAFKTKELKKNKEGVLTLTNKRMLFESLLSKKKDRQTIVDIPINSISKILKEKKGTFVPEGVLIKFNDPNLLELKIATFSDDNSNRLIGYFDDLASGKVDGDLKLGVDAAIRRRFKEIAATYFPAATFCRGTHKDCGTVVSKPIKTFSLNEGPILGIFECPKCHKPFKQNIAS